MPRIFIADSLPVEGLAILERLPGVELDKRPGLKGEELQKALAAADGMVVRSGTTVTAELLKNPGRLRVIVRAGVGVDNIDVPAATRAGVVVMNTPGGNTVSTAEHTFAMIMAMVRHIPGAVASLKGGKWERSKFVGSQLAGRTLGIIGLGRIGMTLARRAAAFEMKVIGFDPFMAPAKAAESGVETAASIAELLPKVDILTVHVPLTDETKDLIGAAELASMRPGSFVVNCARGGIINEEALKGALESKHLAGAALDVFNVEPITDSPLFGLPNVVVTPHLGASTAEAQLNVAIEAAQLLSDFFQHGNIRFAVNMASLDATEVEDTRLHWDLARRLGLLHAQLAKGPVRKATLEYRGDAAKRKTKLLTAGFAQGLLEGALEEDVNLVNAALLAEERGIEINEISSTEPGDFRTLIHARVETESEVLEAAGTTRGSQFLRLVKLGPYRLDAYLDGNMMIYWHQDKPGVIGLVGTVLGRHGVNIASMMVGRNEQGGPAIGVLGVDTPPPEAAMEEIRGDERISAARVVKLPPPGQVPW